MKASNIQKKLEMVATDIGNRLFRNNVGKAWIGSDSLRFDETRTITVNRGDVLIKHGRRFHAGLCKGSSDLIGWTTVEITPDMVGHKVAVFTAPEVKAGTDRLGKDQKTFIQVVENAGGIAGEVRSVNDYHELIENFRIKINFS